MPNDGDLAPMRKVAKNDFHLGTYVVPGTAGVVLHMNETNSVVVDDLPSLRAIGFHYLWIPRHISQHKSRFWKAISGVFQKFAIFFVHLPFFRRKNYTS